MNLDFYVKTFSFLNLKFDSISYIHNFNFNNANKISFLSKFTTFKLSFNTFQKDQNNEQKTLNAVQEMS